jgi:hypothetical protein
MIPNLPVYINALFIATTLLTILLFYKASKNSIITIVLLFTWIILQAVLGLSGFYSITNTFPPRFAIMALPALLFIIILFSTARGRVYLDSLDAKALTILHVIRIPVELCLYWLSLHEVIPKLMTFEGRNFDIIAGLTAPIIFYLGYVKKRLNKTVLLLWNFICLVLLLNIVINAVLSAPSSFQQFAFEQPNTAILYFPFVWLPCCVVPLVLLAHLVCIRKLLIKKTN